jgi:hypothetical protein
MIKVKDNIYQDLEVLETDYTQFKEIKYGRHR